MNEPEVITFGMMLKKKRIGECYYNFKVTVSLNISEREVSPGVFKVYYGQEGRWVCMIHGQESKHQIHEGSTEPCLALDPYP